MDLHLQRTGMDLQQKSDVINDKPKPQQERQDLRRREDLCIVAYRPCYSMGPSEAVLRRTGKGFSREA
jgi:hypothetical protein